MNIHTSLTQLIGNTPLLRLGKLEVRHNLDAKLVAKLESFNPLCSSKDRAIYAMICAAEHAGVLRPETVIIEATSGNAGVSLAFICAIRNYRLILVMPETVSAERRTMLTALGAEVELTPGPLGMKGAVERAKRIGQELPHTYMPNQFENPVGPAIHRETTAEEIWRDTDGSVDIVVASFGTGATLTGVAQGLRARSPQVRVIGVEPAASAVASGQKPGLHKIQGIGAGFVPEIMDLSLLDEIYTVSDSEAFAAARELARAEGVLAGASSGAAIHAAIQVARRPENKGKLIVAILPDTGERYLSSGVFVSG